MTYQIEFNGGLDVYLAAIYFNDRIERRTDSFTKQGNERYLLKGYKRGECIIHRSRGYSQGDYAEVFAPDTEGMGEHIDNLLWDLPISGYLTFNGEEYYITDYIKDEYTWNKEEFIKAVVMQRAKRMHKGMYDALMLALPDVLEVN